jgi:nucleotide-binding universal stress UspA family protein
VLTVAEPLELQAAEDALRSGIEALPANLSAGGLILSGRPAVALAAATTDLGLLVCGSRGYGPLRTLLLGGTSHALVREAACPVIVMPPATTDHHPSRNPSASQAVAALRIADPARS